MKASLVFVNLLISLFVFSQNFSLVTDTGFPDLTYSHQSWADFNNDSFLDLVITGADDAMQAHSLIFKNNGDQTFTLQTQDTLPGVMLGYTAWCDYNNDGWIDLSLMGQTADGSYIFSIYKNNKGNVFTYQSQIELVGLASGSIDWADFNLDGYFDFVVCGYDMNSNYQTLIYINNGNETFSKDSLNQIPGVINSRVVWGDYNNDNYPDLLINGYTGNGYVTQLYANNGDGTFSENSNTAFASISTGAISWCDYNNDGWLDISVMGNNMQYYPLTYIYKNNCDGSFTLQSQFDLQGITFGSLSWADFDNDGFSDLILSGNNTSFSATTILYKNNGADTFEIFNAGFPNLVGGQNSWADFNNDNDLDILLSGANEAYVGSTQLYQGNNSSSNTPPTTPTNLYSTVSEQNVLIGWHQSSDFESSDFALTYNAYLYNMVTGDTLWNVAANKSSGKLRIPAPGFLQSDTCALLKGLKPGSYQWSVQSVDNGFNSSAFAAEASFVIPKFNQQIVFDSIPAKTYGDEAFDIWATASSGGNVTFTIADTNIAELRGSAVFIKKAGTTYITASQFGNDNYNEASFTRTLHINKAAQSIKMELPDSLNLAIGEFSVILNVNSGLPITLSSSDESKVFISDTVLVLNNTGKVTITASQDGNENYQSAPQVSKLINIYNLTALKENPQPQIYIYNNLASHNIAVGTNDKGNLYIYSLTGKVVALYTLIQKDEIIELKGLQNGMYVLQFISSTNQQTIRKIIID
jgi:hypothetical protein